MTLQEARLLVRALLSEGGADFPEREADILLCAAAEVSLAEILVRPDTHLPPEKALALIAMARRRTEGRPLQYILGEWDFYGRTVEVSDNVLIPRPETEQVVEKALEVFKGGTFLDWGTGTGCIALSLLARFPSARGIAADMNPAALVTAWRNLGRHGCRDRCLLWHSRTPDDIPCEDSSLDMIVSNPPYIPSSRIPFLQKEVCFEPLSALDGGADGLDWYRLLLAWGPEKVREGGTVLFEVGDGEQAETLKQIAPSTLKCKGIFRDLQNKPRSILWVRV